MIPIYDIEQGSEAWFLAKSGRPSAGSFDRIITTKGEPSKTRTDYLFELVSQRIIGPYPDSYTNPHMLRGLAMEPEGRALFELLTGFEVKQVGLVYKDESQRVVCSPDGLLPSAGLEQKTILAKANDPSEQSTAEKALSSILQRGGQDTLPILLDAMKGTNPESRVALVRVRVEKR